MFFKNYLTSVVDILQARFEGIQRKGQNPADRGELCELFIKEFLVDTLSDQFRIYRGGKIVNIHNDDNGSKQIDIILTSRNSLRIFSDKGIYPIESVYGVFSVTATLDLNKLGDCLREFYSIPKRDPRFICGNLDFNRVMLEWHKHFPFKCVFAFTGNMNTAWEDYLDNIVRDDPALKPLLPDLIVINKKGVIVKVDEDSVFVGEANAIGKHFHFTDFSINQNYHYCLLFILNRLFILSDWQYRIMPRYYDYFNRELEELPEN